MACSSHTAAFSSSHVPRKQTLQQQQQRAPLFVGPSDPIRDAGRSGDADGGSMPALCIPASAHAALSAPTHERSSSEHQQQQQQQQQQKQQQEQPQSLQQP